MSNFCKCMLRTKHMGCGHTPQRIQLNGFTHVSGDECGLAHMIARSILAPHIYDCAICDHVCPIDCALHVPGMRSTWVCACHRTCGYEFAFLSCKNIKIAINKDEQYNHIYGWHHTHSDTYDNYNLANAIAYTNKLKPGRTMLHHPSR